MSFITISEQIFFDYPFIGKLIIPLIKLFLYVIKQTYYNLYLSKLLLLAQTSIFRSKLQSESNAIERKRNIYSFFSFYLSTRCQFKFQRRQFLPFVLLWLMQLCTTEALSVSSRCVISTIYCIYDISGCYCQRLSHL